MENSSRNRDGNQRTRGNHPQNQQGLKRVSDPDRNSGSRNQPVHDANRKIERGDTARTSNQGRKLSSGGNRTTNNRGHKKSI